MKIILFLGLSAIASVFGTAPAAAQPAGSVFKDCPDCPEMVVIPAGRFTMGSKPDTWWFKNLQSSANEQPQRTVTVQSFALGKLEVTQAQWVALMGDNPSFHKGQALPVERISWNDTQVYLQRLSAKSGKQYRLPTEAEWEYAVRAGSTKAFSFGDDIKQLPKHAWFQDNAGGTTQPVGLKLANRFGLHDMHGNVWEWVQDCWQETYAGAPSDASQAVHAEPCRRVFRSGSWASGAVGNRSARRERDELVPAAREFLGLRVARTLP